MGVDPFRGPLQVWERLTMGKESEPTERMRIGSALEEPIARLWARETGSKVRLNTYTHTRGHLAATPDGFTRGGLLEVKYSAYSDMWGAGVPEHIHWQCVAQSWVQRGPQRKRVTVVGLVEGKLREWTIEPTRAERFEVRDVVDRFMDRYVATNQIPIPMFPHELLTYLYLLQGKNPEERRPATEAEQAAGDRYVALRTSLRAYETEAEAARSALLSEVYAGGDPRARIVADGWTLTIGPPKAPGEVPRVLVTTNRGGTPHGQGD
jgi:hypothetical protein